MKKKYNIIFLLSFQMLFLHAQDFSGKLTYKLEPIHKPSGMDIEFWGEKQAFRAFDTAIVELLLSKKNIIIKIFTSTGELRSTYFQNENKAYLMNEDSSTMVDYSKIPIQKTKEIKFIEKTKEAKYILGILCKKYVYTQSGNEFIVWLPENLVFVKQRQYGKFFNDYFFPHGLCFEKEIRLESSKESWNNLILTKLELFDVTDEDFEKFIKITKR